MKKPKLQAERWLRQAEHDLLVAQANFTSGFYSDCCFMSESYTKDQASRALEFAQEILELVKQKVG